jgi:ribosomal protein S18 acetylase RimI-like enzyme
MFEIARDEDLPPLVALVNRAYRGIGAAAGWSTETAYISGNRTTEPLLREELRASPQAVLLKWVERPDDRPIGCVWLEPLRDGAWYLGTLATDPDRQNAGLGRTLLSAAEHWIAERGGTRVRMTVVNVREALIAWYLRRGYRPTGETEPFPYDDDRFGTPLREDLAFVVLEKELVDGRG